MAFILVSYFPNENFIVSTFIFDSVGISAGFLHGYIEWCWDVGYEWYRQLGSGHSTQ